MREILFRGKRKDNEDWAEGCLLHDSEQNESYIAECFEARAAYIREVIPETVGQYTGLTDKNGKNIFEDDVVKGKDNLEKDIEVYGFVDHENGSFVIVGDSITHYRWLDYDVEVIGNIHDNPELLKGGAEE